MMAAGPQSARLQPTAYSRLLPTIRTPAPDVANHSKRLMHSPHACSRSHPIPYGVRGREQAAECVDEYVVDEHRLDDAVRESVKSLTGSA